jgi:hypothetical protein
MTIRFNLNTILLILGGLGVFSPDVASLAAWLASMHVAWLASPIRILGAFSLFCSSAPLVVPRLRALLSTFGLATPPGAQAPWDPRRDTVPVTMPPASDATPNRPPPPGVRPGAGYPGPGKAAALLFLAAALLAGSARAQPMVPPLPSPQLGFCVDAWHTCFQPAAALSAFQINLKTGDYQRVALMAGYGGVWRGGPVDIGAAIYAGVGISATSPNAAQASLLFSFSDLAAAGPGVQVFRDPLDQHLIWQGLLTAAINYNVGASPTFLRKAAADAEYRGVERGLQAAGMRKVWHQDGAQ